VCVVVFLLMVSFLMYRLLISLLRVCAVIVVFRDAYVLCLSCSLALVGVILCVMHCLLNHLPAIVYCSLSERVKKRFGL
jgi:hypothetical protein